VALVVHAEDVAAEPHGDNAQRQRLLSAAQVMDTRVLLERWTLAPRGRVDVDVPPGSLAWFQVLEGEIALLHVGREERLTPAHIVFFPPRFRGALASGNGAALLYAEVPEAARLDPEFHDKPPGFRIVDWTREPVLESEHDARKRVYVATPGLFGTRAIKGEMIIYPPGTEAPNHHHEGAEHFMYFTRGRGTAWANETPFPVKQGDLVRYADRERHYLRSEGAGDMVFVEFFVPGEARTIWAPGAAVCAWLPTGRDIEGRRPAREIAAHSSALVRSPRDV
jgi:quercetin dioxygenase-like cupin family protein